MVRAFAICAPLLALALGGCLAKTAVGVATAPVRVAARAADMATVSQDEADQARGQAIRRRETQIGALDREFNRLATRCEQGEDRACRSAIAVRREIERMLPTVPVEPE